MKPSKWNTACLLIAFFLFTAGLILAITGWTSPRVPEGLGLGAGAWFVAAHHRFPPRGE